MAASVVISAFYKFAGVDDCSALRDTLLAAAETHDMFGSILVAPEGINGTIAGGRAATDNFFEGVRADSRFVDLVTKESFADEVPFKRMKVRLKKEIVTLRQGVDPTTVVGTYIDSSEWNRVIADPDVLVIDTRNREEVELGTFANAVDPGTESFTEFVDYVAGLNPAEHPKVAMFCTGGIRCEKASSYMIEQGFGEVVHLNGGILKYLEDVPAEDSMWQGECFVFDERVSVDHDLRPGDYTLCRGCRHPLAAQDRTGDDYEEGVSCRHCVGTLDADRRASLRERQLQETLAQARGERHIARDDTSR